LSTSNKVYDDDNDDTVSRESSAADCVVALRRDDESQAICEAKYHTVHHFNIHEMGGASAECLSELFLSDTVFVLCLLSHGFKSRACYYFFLRF